MPKRSKSKDSIEQFNPTEGQVLCEAVQEAEKIGSIIIPDSAKTPLTQGIVLKSGGLCDQDLYVRGRLIIFRLHTESKITVAGIEYVLVEPANILLTGPILKDTSELGD